MFVELRDEERLKIESGSEISRCVSVSLCLYLSDSLSRSLFFLYLCLCCLSRYLKLGIDGPISTRHSKEGRNIESVTEFTSEKIISDTLKGGERETESYGQFLCLCLSLFFSSCVVFVSVSVLS